MVARFFVCLVTWLVASPVIAEAPLLTATEMVLPRYQSLSLDRDFPASDMLLDGDTLYITGKKSLWKWNLRGQTLRRIRLLKNNESGNLQGLVTDGLALMTAFDGGVFRIRKDPLRVLKFTHPMAIGGRTLGITGASDKMLWVHSKAILEIDRYGRTLIPRYTKTGLRQGDQVHYHAESQVMWIVSGNEIRRTVVADQIAAPKAVFKARNRIRGLQLVGTQVMAHTSKTVVRLDSTGKHLQSIPVAGDRELATMQITDDFHAYLFTDGLLEVFVLAEKTHRRYRLPLENPSRATLAINNNLATVIDDGIPRAFSLSQPVK